MFVHSSGEHPPHQSFVLFLNKHALPFFGMFLYQFRGGTGGDARGTHWVE